MSDPIEVILDHLDQDELLCQLAEEASELSQAALKLRRAYNQKNPTPKTAQQCYEALLEEVADVSVCCTALGYDSPLSRSRMAVVEGRLQITDWTDKDGNKRRKTEVVVEQIYFGDSKPAGQSSAPPQNYGAPPAQEFTQLDDDDGELPF